MVIFTEEFRVKNILYGLQAISSIQNCDVKRNTSDLKTPFLRSAPSAQCNGTRWCGQMGTLKITFLFKYLSESSHLKNKNTNICYSTASQHTRNKNLLATLLLREGCNYIRICPRCFCHKEQDYTVTSPPCEASCGKMRGVILSG